MSKSLAHTADFMDRMVPGMELSDAGEHDRAEAYFRRLVAATRGVHAGNEFRALHGLLTHYGRTGRFFEAIVVARVRLSLAEAEGDAADQADACLTLAHGLVAEGYGDLTRRLLDRVSALRASDASIRQRTDPTYGQIASTIALEDNDPAAARTYVDIVRRSLGPGRDHQEMLIAVGSKEAQILLAEQRFTEVEAALRPLRALETAQASIAIGVLEIELRTALGMSDLPAVRTHADRLLQFLEDTGAAASVHVVRYSRLLAGVYRDTLGDSEKEEAALDLAAGAILRRMAQVERCLREMPELGPVFEEASRELVGLRKSFATEYHDVLQRVSSLLERDAGWMKRLLHDMQDSRFVAICAWCERVRTVDGGWIPVGEFVVRTESYSVTHGICPPCADAVRGA